MRENRILSIQNVKFSLKVAQDPAHPDTITLNLVKKRKLI
jgi:hypothetical protein